VQLLPTHTQSSSVVHERSALACVPASRIDPSAADAKVRRATADGPDYARVVEGMGDPTKSLGAIVKRLSYRWFVLRDARAGTPVLFQPCWEMSLLRGPMTRSELERARTERDAPVSNGWNSRSALDLSST
jgi:hypothetical protein